MPNLATVPNLATLFRRPLFLGVAVCVLSLVGCDSRPGLNPGDAAPGFTLPLLDGGTRSLDSFQGKISLLNFWASWCEPCREELPSLSTLQRSFSEGEAADEDLDEYEDDDDYDYDEDDDDLDDLDEDDEEDEDGDESQDDEAPRSKKRRR